MQKTNIAICSVLLSVVALGTLGQLAFAQSYSPANSQTTLEEQLKLARERIAIVQQNPGAGSGTPFLGAGGFLTAIIFAAVAFGTIFGIFIWRAKAHEAALKARR